MSDQRDFISAVHDALAAADIEYTGYSCNGVNLIGDKASIDKAMAAFHYASQIDWYQRNLRHWREECGKLHAKLQVQNSRLSALTDDQQEHRGGMPFGGQSL